MLLAGTISMDLNVPEVFQVFQKLILWLIGTYQNTSQRTQLFQVKPPADKVFKASGTLEHLNSQSNQKKHYIFCSLRRTVTFSLIALHNG
ncbi:hypothetical protein D0962_16695 [Leptolyngbyaceae cyanobacterium CCMR0082]|uniref:Uncharacterized protein n=1 Tax=Adonisia turfae CCMR0082 TaxID=2304604 RepID=A0A6M0S7G8_9CYAN|nr:hypothetical protein [Adonisia turfae CCMR0082]